MSDHRNLASARLLRTMAIVAAVALLYGRPSAAADTGTDGAPTNEVFLFTSFRENGGHGLQFLASEDGLQWTALPGVFLKPQTGTGKLMRDPSLARDPDGVYHSAWYGDLGFGYARSSDLVNWSDQRFIPPMQHEAETVNVWAPELFYDEDQSRFIICCAAMIPGRFPDYGEPHDNNQRMYCTTTRHFELFTPTTLFFDPGFSVIDATIVKADSRYVLVLKENSCKCMKLRVAFGQRPLGPWSNVSERFMGMYAEGPSVAKLGDHWYVYYYYDAYREGRYGAAKTRDFKLFVDVSAAVAFPTGHKHGTVLRVPRSLVENLAKAVVPLKPDANTPPVAEDAEAAYTRTIAERAEKIVKELALSDAKTSARLRDILVAQYRTLRDVHAERDAKLANLKPDSDEHREVEADIANQLFTGHRRFVAQLASMLTRADVDRVKDALTYGIVPITYRRYLELLPDLSPEQKSELLANLLEAREYAMDASSSEAKHAWFGKYKGRNNNFLSAAGYDMKAAEKALAEREKAKRP
jgi:hypothetical protein